ncbi:MAG: methyltransferase domain-containing protein [Desulfosarcinaceae bacterium]
MSFISPDITTDLFFQVNWQSGPVRHTEAYAARRVNLYRDLLPPRVYDSLMKKQSGDRFRLAHQAGEIIGAPSLSQTLRLSKKQFDPHRLSIADLVPRVGRFYPKGLLRDVSGIFSSNGEPFRCVEVSGKDLVVNLNHPLSGKATTMRITVGKVEPKPVERGGVSLDWPQIITEGVGMQARWQERPTDFFSGHPFERDDVEPDALFYENPRLVQHLDDTALDVVREVHGRFLRNGMHALDLMSSWQTHLPEGLMLERLAAIGLNAVELSKNEALTDWTISDLNANPVLPYATSSFDAVLCALSVEYLIHPLEVFAEVARVLKPGGAFVVTFSNRWFPPKAIGIWKELHDFERMGLVLEYFLAGGRYGGLQTYSLRGLERPRNDQYWGKTAHSDPVYAVWGLSR